MQPPQICTHMQQLENAKIEPPPSAMNEPAPAAAAVNHEGGGNPNFGREKGMTHVSFSMDSQIFKYGPRLVKEEGFKCNYSSFWISLQIWTITLKMAYLEN